MKEAYLLIPELWPQGRLQVWRTSRGPWWCSWGTEASACYLCACPLPSSGSLLSLRNELIHSLSNLVFMTALGDPLRSPGSGGQWGLQLWSHRTVYICILSELLPEGLAYNQPTARC